MARKAGEKNRQQWDPLQIQTIVDAMTNGLGYTGTHLLVTEYCIEHGYQPVCSTCIYKTDK